jgi:hypothetical protein
VLQEMKPPVDGNGLLPRGLAVDRELVHRIVLSSAFAKSPRLSHFLRYICTEAEEGRQGKINEQRIGSAVFGRDPDYDSTVDSIVRSHASRLRHRLREYFETQSVHEPVVLTIPKGSYIPRFELRSQEENSPAAEPVTRQPIAGLSSFEGAVTIATEPPHEHDESTVRPSAPMPVQRQSALPWQIAFAAATITSLVLGIAFALHMAGPRHQKNHVFWSTFLDPRHGHTTLVEADSGLVMLQHFTHRPVSLASYIDGSYLHDVASPDQKPDLVAKLGSRRYTPAVDGAIYEKVSHLLPETQDRLNVRYARDLRLDDLKQGNAILLGTHESDPWVELFEDSMNFTFRNDLAAGTTSMLNRHPLAAEQAIYPMLSNDPAHTVYGLVAFRPNLTHTGHVLIIEGETMAGTQTASEFLLDDAHFLPFLKSIQKKDGPVPHFEVLIRSSSLGGESSRIEMVAYRIDRD